MENKIDFYFKMDNIKKQRRLKLAYRESSIFNKKYAGVLGAEKNIMMREIMRKDSKNKGERENILTPMNNPNSSFFKLFGHVNQNYHLSPSQLIKRTNIEIFNSNKNTLKKNLNYINYTKHDHDVITNQALSSAYSSFRSDMFKYKREKPDSKRLSKTRFLDRSPPGSNTPKKHILKNIRHIK